MASANKYETYEIQEIHRSDIHFAEYNPRILGDKERKRLKRNIETVGLVEPIVWNKITGRIVSGHQRVKIMDSLHKGKDYSLRVAVVEMSEKQEKEQNIFMNNQQAQGDFDLDALEKLMKDDIDIEATGFDFADVHKMFGSDPSEAQPEELEAMANSVREGEAALAKMKEKAHDRDNPDYFLVIVFPGYEERKAFLDKYEMEDNRYISQDDFEAIIEQRARAIAAEATSPTREP